MDDFELLQAYVTRQAEDAFETLVGRHVNLVYASALRQLRTPELAEEVTQAVFTILARKAASIRQGTVLAGWLLRTTRYTAANARRREQRRQNLEREAMNHLRQNSSGEAWEQIAPVLDEALFRLSEKDRVAVALRFFEQKSCKEIALTVGRSESSVRMRLGRAVERLRTLLTRRGIMLSAIGLTAILEAHGAPAAPPGLAKSVALAATAAAKGAAATGAISALVSMTLSSLAWLKIKTAALIGLPVGLVLGLTCVAPAILERSTGPNLVRNGGFQDGFRHWGCLADKASNTRASFTTEMVPGAKEYAAKISVLAPSFYDSVEINQGGVAVTAGHKYTVSFRGRSTVTQPLRVKLIRNREPWNFYGFRVITELTPQWKQYRLTGRAMASDDDAKIVFSCGAAAGDIWIDDVKLQDEGEG